MIVRAHCWRVTWFRNRTGKYRGWTRWSQRGTKTLRLVQDDGVFLLGLCKNMVIETDKSYYCGYSQYTGRNPRILTCDLRRRIANKTSRFWLVACTQYQIQLTCTCAPQDATRKHYRRIFRGHSMDCRRSDPFVLYFFWRKGTGSTYTYRHPSSFLETWLGSAIAWKKNKLSPVLPHFSAPTPDEVLTL